MSDFRFFRLLTVGCHMQGFCSHLVVLSLDFSELDSFNLYPLSKIKETLYNIDKLGNLKQSYLPIRVLVELNHKRNNDYCTYCTSLITSFE